MNDFKSILPSNENLIERTIEELGARIFNFEELDYITLDPMKCDASLLPHLAFDLDVSILGLDEDEARVYLVNAREIKRLTGSVWAVNKAAFSVFGENIKVQPWNKVGTVPGTFKIEVDVTPQKSVTDENLNKTIRLIDTAKPESRHLSGITINMKNNGAYKTNAVTTSSEVGYVFPKTIEDIETSINHKSAISVYMIEKIVIKP
ncbi:phage tail protein I [Malaciobacter mytili LMG 24559]|uniref:Phage tail protein I n=1 Tax=Malaciobacter mytili LMG 24559 TaxID=1032238 RepID=A0AAX2AH38_9BACT|nr:phage tail protein I [Malaciobacter mytili]AXH14375.1 phage tail protein, P2 family [Malaciobacter mytili LMG 24559]RXK16049.1 phage tail protein I [Malaciobacter mytili LMG 24559]